MKKRKILVTGSLGTVGSYIPSVFKNDDLILTTKLDLDITDKKNVLAKISKERPDVVIHLAAKTNVDECEKNQREAHRVNTIGTKNIALACQKNNTTLVYISTGAVFGGKKPFFTENDKPNPINVYGKTKLLGEHAIKSAGCKYIILRAGWIIGGGKKEKKFISYILKQIKDGQKEIKVINDKFGTITGAKELVKLIKKLLDQKQSGTFHFASLGTCSRFEIAKYVVKLLKKKVTVIPVSSSVFQKNFFAQRPKYEVIQSAKLPKNNFRSWQKSLKDYILNELK
ncbi:MAG: SDR family oxidoreductase [Candidatus Levyibacteriota bacterium]|jgi:dTDP-4-dehydrorhamnose reductase